MAADGIGNILKVPELKKRLLFTLAMMAVFRLGSHIPVPGIHAAALQEFFASMQGTMFAFFDMFTGGALSKFTIFALGIMPYISSSIILQLLTVSIPHLEKLKKEGEAGQKKITQYTRYGTIVLGSIQGLGIAFWLESMTSPSGAPVVLEPGFGFRFVTVLTLTCGTAFLMWLGEQVTDRGVGNGISLIIFAGIVAQMPAAIMNSFRMLSTGELTPIAALIALAMMIIVTGIIVFVETGQRRIPIQYAKRVVGRKMVSGQSSHLPLKVNTAGVIPPIFASSIIMFPATLVTFIQHPWMNAIADRLHPGTFVYTVIYVTTIIFFCFFYTSITFNPVDVADNMKKNGGFIPGIRPGKPTADYIDHTLSRLTVGGALYLSLVCVVPDFMIGMFSVPFYFGGTGLLIIVGVSMDFMSQVESHMYVRNYSGAFKGGRKGR